MKLGGVHFGLTSYKWFQNRTGCFSSSILDHKSEFEPKITSLFPELCDKKKKQFLILIDNCNRFNNKFRSSKIVLIEIVACKF